MTRKAIIGVAIIVAAGLSATLMGAAQAYEALLDRQVEFRYIDEALSLPPETLKVIEWQEPVREIVRPLNRSDQLLLNRRIGDAWKTFALAQDTGETSILADWFGGVALERAQRAAETAFAGESRMVVLRMKARPSFYHLDGSVLQLETEALTARYIVDDEGLALFELGEDETVSTLVNRSTGWHVAAHERREWTPHMHDRSARAVPDKLAGINYYPSLTPWRKFWPNYDSDETGRDFDLVRGLGANAVRVFLLREDFLPGMPDLDRRLDHLRDLLAQADRHGLYVVPTLFDLKSSYSAASWSQDIRYLDTVLPVLREAPAVALVDIKNEPDLDFNTQGRGHVLAWLRTMAAVIRTDAPDLPLTVGWSAADSGAELWDILDAVSYHDYAPIEGATERLLDVQSRAGGLPVFVTEIGSSSWEMARNYPGSPSAQDAALQTRLEALEASDGIFVWALHDFPDPDSSAIGTSFWIRGLQSRFGLHDMSGQPKAAAATVARAFSDFLKGNDND